MGRLNECRCGLVVRSNGRTHIERIGCTSGGPRRQVYPDSPLYSVLGRVASHCDRQDACKGRDGYEFLRNFKFVEANAKRRNLYGLRNFFLRSLNDFDSRLLAHFIG